MIAACAVGQEESMVVLLMLATRLSSAECTPNRPATLPATDKPLKADSITGCLGSEVSHTTDSAATTGPHTDRYISSAWWPVSPMPQKPPENWDSRTASASHRSGPPAEEAGGGDGPAGEVGPLGETWSSALSLIWSSLIDLKTSSRYSRAKSVFSFTPRLFRMKSSTVIRFFTFGLCWSELSMMMLKVKMCTASHDLKTPNLSCL
mmetsp:Transcript_43223/g.102074  ORF Transcript_43223/g.102074 Transcript_43223/m.102074 type:complete len:206 (-) Transcript_43223:808-1425(-)